MSGRAGWSYVQARVQARHGERLREDDWRVLEGAKSLDHFLDRSRTTSLRGFTDRLDAQMSSHTIERALRAEWRRYVAEVAGWVPPVWRPPVLWVAHVPDLPILDGLLKAAAPQWALQDRILVAFADGNLQKSPAIVEGSPLAPLSTANGGALIDRWLAHWRLLWPRRPARDCQWLEELYLVVADNLKRLAQASVSDTSLPYRRELAHALTRIFRRRSGTPVSPFSHLALVALDLERLRGALIRRRLFHAALEQRTA